MKHFGDFRVRLCAWFRLFGPVYTGFVYSFNCYILVFLTISPFDGSSKNSSGSNFSVSLTSLEESEPFYNLFGKIVSLVFISNDVLG
jgi:hypothetical protein